jgi:hypothetical protein
MRLPVTYKDDLAFCAVVRSIRRNRTSSAVCPHSGGAESWCDLDRISDSICKISRILSELVSSDNSLAAGYTGNVQDVAIVS